MAITNDSAAALVDAAMLAGRTLTVPCPNGDTVTAGAGLVLRWGRSRFALPSGLAVGSTGAAVVQNCGRGAAARAARGN